MASEDVDLIVIGSGQGGTPLAIDAAKAGQRVVLFERGRYGGSCLNYGCTPSKALLAAAHSAGRARDAGPLGVHADVRVDQRAVFERLRRIRSDWSAATEKHLRDAGVELVHAQATFTGERTVAGGGRELRGTRVVIDTGTSPAVPAIPGLHDVPYLTNTTFFDLETLPQRLIVIGGGYIGLELGQGARRLGADVTLVHQHERIMEREEHDAARVLHEALEADGIRFLLGRHATHAERTPDGLRLTLDDGSVLEADGLLVAVGRIPSTADLGVHHSGVECRHGGYVTVNDYLETTCPGVYALGDVAGQPAFTHVSYEDFRRLKSTFAGVPRKRDDRVLAYTTFTEPQLARVGTTEHDAKAAGIDAHAATVPVTAAARATEWCLERGFYRIVVDRATEKIIGATFVGYEAGELIHIVLAHMMNGATWRVLDDSVHVHPTFAEALPDLARAAGASA